MRHDYDISGSVMGDAEDPRPMGRDALSFGRVALDAFREPSAFICSLKGVLGLLDLYMEVKLTLEQATKAQRGSRGIALLFH
jgi:hypothetical protein